VKFLCVPCDQPMKLATVGPPDRGSLSVLYSCPACGYEMAMLTNPYETQIVQSLGVKVGGATAEGAAADAAAEGSRCPFAGMIGASDAAGAAAGEPGAPTAGGPALATSASGAGAAAVVPRAADPIWTETASERMKAVPAFVRPMARTGIERFARDRGYATIDEKVLEEARAFFGM
jgi:hypothetical protein